MKTQLCFSVSQPLDKYRIFYLYLQYFVDNF